MPGKGVLTLTGLLGESMRESAQAAMSYLRSHAKLLAIDTAWFTQDRPPHPRPGRRGPQGRPFGRRRDFGRGLDEPVPPQGDPPDLAMTGEVTLTGRVLPVGGVREKVLAARRAGIKTVLIPRHNEKDLIELPAEVKADVTFHAIDTLDDVVPHLFSVPKTKPAKPKTRPRLTKPKTTGASRVVPEKPHAPVVPTPKPAKRVRPRTV